MLHLLVLAGSCNIESTLHYEVALMLRLIDHEVKD